MLRLLCPRLDLAVGFGHMLCTSASTSAGSDTVRSTSSRTSCACRSRKERYRPLAGPTPRMRSATPFALFRWLCASLLFSAQIGQPRGRWLWQLGKNARACESGRRKADAPRPNRDRSPEPPIAERSPHAGTWWRCAASCERRGHWWRAGECLQTVSGHGWRLVRMPTIQT